MRVCFGTVIYKQAQEFFADLVRSVEKQTAEEFDLLIINDNYSKEELYELDRPEDAIVVDMSDKKLSPGMYRIEMLLEAKRRGYDLLISGDADDTFAPTRVEACIRAAQLDKDAAFYYNELITDTGAMVFKELPDRVDDIRQLSQANFIGMSTAAINLRALSYEFLESLREGGDTRIFDWYLFSRIVLDAGYGVLVRDAATIYRIYDNNTVGVTHNIDQELQVKLAHYEVLGQRYEYFRKLREDLLKLDLNTINTADNQQGYWWSNIRMEERYEV